MRIVMASSEAVPFAKTGGLADVATALSKSLARAGHEVWLVLPHYPQSIQKQSGLDADIEPTGETLEIQVGPKRVVGKILKSSLADSDVNVLLIDQPDYFDRPGLYQENGEDFSDNCERFVFFSRAVLAAAQRLDIRPDIVHANDWQTGLIPALLKLEYGQVAGFEKTASIFTIHNMAFQGQFWHWDMALTGIDWKHFNTREMEYYGDINLLKTGIVFCDIATTVSPTYSQEIQTEEFGCGLHGVLQEKGDRLVGILNGVDTDVWNPETDRALAENYAPPRSGEFNALKRAKGACKSNLQEQQGLPVRADVPLFGMISRLTDQKGLDLTVDCVDRVIGLDMQMTFLGTGDARYEDFLSDAARRHPEKIATTIGFDDALARRIEAGADIFLMPSRYEPCGLNQMYSQMYGTVPIVRRVGGLADSVIDASGENLEAGTATGFCFDNYESDALLDQMQRAVRSYSDHDEWMKLVQAGMQQDWSWKRSASEYLTAYHRASEI
jgi:starch synthase